MAKDEMAGGGNAIRQAARDMAQSPDDIAKTDLPENRTESATNAATPHSEAGHSAEDLADAAESFADGQTKVSETMVRNTAVNGAKED